MAAAGENSGQSESGLVRCAYCGAPLDWRYYFCLACATPYQHPDRVVCRPSRPPSVDDQELILREVPQAGRLFFSYLAVIVAVGFLSWHYDLSLVRSLVLNSIFLLGATAVFAVLYFPALRVQFCRFGFNRGAAWIGILALAPMLAVNYLYATWLEQYAEVTSQAEMFGDLEIGATLFLVAFLPGVSEEIAFRGLLQHWLQVRVTPVRAMVLTSLLFVALHFSALAFPYLFALSMLLGWVKWRTGSLYPVIAMHILHNAVVVYWLQS